MRDKILTMTMRDKIQSGLSYFCYGTFGMFVVLSLFLLFVVLFPILIYRLLVTKVIAPLFNPDIVEAVNVNGQALATEFLNSHRNEPTRCTLVTAVVLEGNIDNEKFIEKVQKGWIETRNEETGELMYPELRQYIEQWLGFMFWKRDKDFNLRNHLRFHELEETISPLESKKSADELMETLISKPHELERSPWQLHVIKNFRDPEYLYRTPEKSMTLILFRCHHSMADGFSVFQLLVEGLVDVAPDRAQVLQCKKKPNLFESLLNCIRFPFVMFHDIGYTVLILFRERTPWHCPNNKKSGKQLYCKSPAISVQRIKFIKNKLNCSFASVIMSAYSKGVAHSFKRKGHIESCKKIPFGISLPLPGHSRRLGNHFTGNTLELSTDPTLTSLERLFATEESYTRAKSSKMLAVTPLIIRLSSFPVAHLARFIFENRYACTGMSSFPGPTIPLEIMGKRVLTCYFGGGGIIGIAGVASWVLSIVDDVHIVITSEAAVLSRAELEDLMRIICEEVNILYEIALKMG